MKKQYRRGDIVLVEGQSLVAKLIGKFTSSKYTHAAVMTGIEDYLIESDIGGVQYNRLSEKYKDLIDKNLSDKPDIKEFFNNLLLINPNIEKNFILKPIINLKSDFIDLIK